MASLFRLLLVTTALGATAFTPLCPDRPTATKLNLLPSQGCQLAAAWNAANPDEDGFRRRRNDENDGHNDNKTGERLAGDVAGVGDSTKTPSSGPKRTARDLVAHLFSLPSAILHPSEEEAEDAVFFPIVGFKFFPDHKRAVPTAVSASCRIHRYANEEVYGWFSPACFLGSIHSDNYCTPNNDTH